MNENFSAESAPSQPGERLHKVLAAAGVGSRRHCEALIAAGRVEVDGEMVTALGVRVDPARQRIAVDTVEIARPKLEYYLVNKPTGVVCTNFDPDGRTRVIDLLPADAKRVYTVGRLDRNSEGLVLMTNDGALAHRLMHPRYEVAKVYDVQVAGEAGRDVAQQLLRGVRLAEGMARASRVQIKRSRGRSTILRITLKEGKNREIRRLLARTGHKVMQLRRVALGPLKLDELPPGQYRRLHDAEVRLLQNTAGSAGGHDADEPDARGQNEVAVSQPPRSPRRNRPQGDRPRGGPGGARRPHGRPPGKPPRKDRRPGAPFRKPQDQRRPALAGLGVIIGDDEPAPTTERPGGKRRRPVGSGPNQTQGKRPRRPDDRREPAPADDRPPKRKKFAANKTTGRSTVRPAGKPIAGKPAVGGGQLPAGRKAAKGRPAGKKFRKQSDGVKSVGKKTFRKKPRRGRPS